MTDKQLDEIKLNLSDALEKLLQACKQLEKIEEHYKIAPTEK